MPFDVLLLPLLGGYIFISNWNYTRFDAKRYSGQRLLFHSAIAGVGLLVSSYVILLVTRHLPVIYEVWESLVPDPGTGTAILSVVLGVAGCPVFNRFCPREEYARKAIKRWGDFLEILLDRSMTETSQVAVTLSSGKFYTGYVTASFDPSYDRKYMKLLPTLSGYRDPKTKVVVFTTAYTKAYKDLWDENPADQFELVIPIASILSANLFDPEFFKVFEVPDTENTSDEIVTRD